MKKKELKFYETPAVECVSTELEGFLCTSTNAKGVEEDKWDDED